jgi:hypothetical protein
MWNALQHGWIPPTKDCSIKKFDKLKYMKPSPEKAYFGFGSSFSGIYFCGHRSKYEDKIEKYNTSQKLINISNDMHNVKFYNRDYTYYSPEKIQNYIL